MAAPSTIGRYQVEAEIGRGGYAVVYRAFDPSLQRRVAIKVPHPALGSDPAAVARFQREAKLAAGLNHRNIVAILDLGEDEGLPFVVMELLDGQPLDRWLREEHPDPVTVTQMIAGLGSALDYAHARGVVHRDVKPANILVVPEHGAVLTDFGIPRVLAGASQSASGVVGTPTYMAPEQASGGTAIAATDIYALGIVLYEVLAGRVPFHGETPAAVAFQQVSVPPPDPRIYNQALPPGVVQPLMLALAKDPTHRPTSAGGLIRDISSGLSAAADVTLPEPMLPLVARPPGRRIPVFPIVIVMMALLVAAGYAMRGRFTLPRAHANTRCPSQVPRVIAVTRPRNRHPSPTASATPTASPTPTQTSSTTPSPAPTPTPAPYVESTEGGVNVRSGPGTDYDQIGAVAAGQRLEVRGVSGAGDWYHVCCVGGRDGWISAQFSRLVGERPPVETAIAPLWPGKGFKVFPIPGNSALSYWQAPSGHYQAYGIPFLLGSGASAVWTSQAEPLPGNPESLALPLRVPNATAVHVLFNGGAVYNEPRFVDKQAANIKLVFDNGATQTVPLFVGAELRDWNCSNYRTVVCTTANPAVKQAWPRSEVSSQYAVDLLSLSVATENRGRFFERLEIEDTTNITIGSKDPAFSLIAVTVQQ